MGVIIRCKLETHNEQNVKIAMCHFVLNFISYISVEHYLI